MLTNEQEEKIKNALLNSANPFYFFHDDPDGLCSFLLLYRYHKEGKGYVVKAVPNLTINHYKNVEEYSADAIFILDLAMVEQDFLDKSRVPVYWLDHHNPLEREKVYYCNPRISFEQNWPTPVMCYQIVKQDLWLATLGCIGDWVIPPFIEEFKQKYPDLLPENIKTVQEALYNSKLGILIKIFSFILKGPTNKVYKNIKILTRIQEPYEILNQTTPQGKFIWKYYETINKDYENLLKNALKTKSKTKLFVYTYSSDKLSLTKDVANELIARFPEKIIVLGRIKDDEVRCSFRAKEGIRLDLALAKSLEGIEGYGGGHEEACGGAIKTHNFEQFLKQLEEALNDK